MSLFVIRYLEHNDFNTGGLEYYTLKLLYNCGN